MAEDIHIIDQSQITPVIPASEFEALWANTTIPRAERLVLLADMARANVLSQVKRAGSGHLGSSLSAMDIVTYLYFDRMNTLTLGYDDPNRDIYFSSKGHDVPGLYSVLYARGVLSQERFLKLRRLGGLDGHPDVGIPGIEANTGSLGMGISKGKGMALAKRMQGYRGHVYVLTGDGEWQEGQNYEALQQAVQHRVGNLTVIVDNNKVQSDKYVAAVTDLGDMVAKFKAFGWIVARCDGHDVAALDAVFAEFEGYSDLPKILIADTIKGRGISFMEHPFAMANNKNLYPWHAGAPDDEAYQSAHREVMSRIDRKLHDLGLDALLLDEVTPLPKQASGMSKEYVTQAYGDELTRLGYERDDLVILDGDLAIDCKVRDFENTHPARFIENGIAEQDMVSTAAGLAALGMLPVVNSFASFLTSRANEQIYNAATEKRRIIYGITFGGLIPAGPGKSHQSVRDISLFGALPEHIIVQPGCAAESTLLTRWCVETAKTSCVIRMNIGPSPRALELPTDYTPQMGCGWQLRHGDDAVIFAYGAVMLHEALVASELLSAQGFGLAVVNMPWLNRVDAAWLQDTLTPHRHVFVLDDHSPVGGLGDFLLRESNRLRLLVGREMSVFAVEGFPACGTPTEVLKVHGLDGESLALRVRG